MRRADMLLRPKRRMGWRGRLTLLFVTVFILSFGLPVGAVSPGGSFPLAWLWSWVGQSPAFAAQALVGLPQQEPGSAEGRAHYVSDDATDVGRGAGTKPVTARGAVGLDQGGTRADGSRAPKIPTNSFDEKVSRRLAAGTEAKSDVYQNPDGSYSRVLTQDPINYRAKDGSWKAIDRSLVMGADGRFGQKSNSTEITLAGVASDMALTKLRLDAEHSFSYGLLGAANVTPLAEGNSLLYREVLPGVDVKLEILASGTKESLILHSAAAGSSFVFPLALEGLSASVAPNGSVELRDDTGVVRATMPAGFMVDSKFDQQTGDFTRSDGMTYELADVNGQQVLRMTLDQAWLNDPARVWPVTADPTIQTGYFGATGDTYVSSTDTADHGGENNLPVGTYDGGTHKVRSLVRFDEFSATYQGNTIAEAWLRIYLTWTYDCTPRAFNVVKPTSSWGSAP